MSTDDSSGGLREAFSELDSPRDRFLTRVVARALSGGWRISEDFLEHFPPRVLIRALQSETETRVTLLVETVGIHPKIAEMLSPEGAAEDLRLAIETGIADARKVISLVPLAKWIQRLNPAALWTFAVDGGWLEEGEKDARHRQRALDRVAFIVQGAIADELITFRDVTHALGDGKIARLLSPDQLRVAFAHALECAHQDRIPEEETLLGAASDVTDLLARAPLRDVWEHLIVEKIAKPHGLAESTESFGDAEAPTGRTGPVPVSGSDTTDHTVPDARLFDGRPSSVVPSSRQRSVPPPPGAAKRRTSAPPLPDGSVRKPSVPPPPALPRLTGPAPESNAPAPPSPRATRPRSAPLGRPSTSTRPPHPGKRASSRPAASRAPMAGAKTKTPRTEPPPLPPTPAKRMFDAPDSLRTPMTSLTEDAELEVSDSEIEVETLTRNMATPATNPPSAPGHDPFPLSGTMRRADRVAPQHSEADRRQSISAELRAIDRLPPNSDYLSLTILRAIARMYEELPNSKGKAGRSQCVHDAFENESHLRAGLLALLELLNSDLARDNPGLHNLGNSSLVELFLEQERALWQQARQSNPPEKRPGRRAVHVPPRRPPRPLH